VTFDEQLDAMIAVRDEGLIAGFGLSNVTLEQLAQARAPIRDYLCAERVQPGRPLG
jgi:diketogulonate reductase-like aldo/keto reductase